MSQIPTDFCQKFFLSATYRWLVECIKRWDAILGVCLQKEDGQALERLRTDLETKPTDPGL